eukprot:GDKJ01007312.1.p1 GENE.GDKJ01007312.1~~GDKJ01007312.1.p1  ORF type:complete len:309 (+),score=48.52 GDKJ01007312.1:54-980(+)
MFEEIFPDDARGQGQSHGIPIVLEDYWTVVGVHGGGERRWEKDHPVFLLSASLGVKRFFTCTQPLHGSRRAIGDILPFDTPESDSAPFPTLDEYVEGFYANLKKHFSGVRVLLICHSGGGMTMQRLWLKLRQDIHPLSTLICIGSGVCEQDTAPMIEREWNVQAYKAQGKFELMSTIHENAHRCTRMIDFWKKVCGVKGEIYLTPEEAKHLYGRENSHRIFAILGNNDQPFPPRSYLPFFSKEDVMGAVTLIESDHYKYFSTYWSATRRALLSVIINNLPLKVAPDEEAAKARKRRAPPPPPSQHAKL